MMQPIPTVGAMILDSHKRVLMIRTHKWSDLWGIPGGKIKYGERSEDALRREIKEETNLDITKIEFILVQDCIGSKEFYREAHFILLNYMCRALNPEEVCLNDEAEEFQWLTFQECFTLDLNRPTRILLDAIALGRLVD
jgi:phosphoglycolate phosphatase